MTMDSNVLIHRFKKTFQLVIWIYFKMLLFAFKVLNGRAPSHLSELPHVHSPGKITEVVLSAGSECSDSKVAAPK